MTGDLNCLCIDPRAYVWTEFKGLQNLYHKVPINWVEDLLQTMQISNPGALS